VALPSWTTTLFLLAVVCAAVLLVRGLQLLGDEMSYAPVKRHIHVKLQYLNNLHFTKDTNAFLARGVFSISTLPSTPAGSDDAITLDLALIHMVAHSPSAG